MDVAIDRAGQHVEPAGIDGFARWRRHLAGGNANDTFAIDRHVGGDGFARRDHGAAADEEINLLHDASSYDPTPIDGEVLAGDVAGAIAGHKQHRVCDINIG